MFVCDIVNYVNWEHKIVCYSWLMVVFLATPFRVPSIPSIWWFFAWILNATKSVLCIVSRHTHSSQLHRTHNTFWKWLSFEFIWLCLVWFRKPYPNRFNNCSSIFVLANSKWVLQNLFFSNILLLFSIRFQSLALEDKFTMIFRSASIKWCVKVWN